MLYNVSFLLMADIGQSIISAGRQNRCYGEQLCNDFAPTAFYNCKHDLFDMCIICHSRAVGCIMAEHTFRPLLPGNSEIDEIVQICSGNTLKTSITLCNDDQPRVKQGLYHGRAQLIGALDISAQIYILPRNEAAQT